jgi:hypothetical protein
MVNTGFMKRRFLWLIGFLCTACASQQQQLEGPHWQMLSQSLIEWQQPPADSALLRSAGLEALAPDSLGFGVHSWVDNTTRLRSLFVTLGNTRVQATVHTLSCPNALEAQHRYEAIEGWLQERLPSQPSASFRFGKREWLLPDRRIQLELNSASNTVVVAVLYLGQPGT